MRWRRLLWIAVSLPALVQVGILLYAVVRRLAYPYDLEWMEGGMLNHALRLSDGRGIYVPPSVDFIPYLYTPLYPWLLAMLGKAFGLSYALGRAVSVLSLVAVLALGAFATAREARGAIKIAAAAAFGGFYAATYPWVEGWYDLVRGDTLQLALGTAGLVVLYVGARRLSLVATAAALLAISFFAKQTGVLFVAAGGAALLLLNWRAIPLYVGVAGGIGGGGSWLLNRATEGWFWTYVFRVHQQHDTNIDRFIRSFGLELGHFPALTAVVLAGLVAVVLRRRAHRALAASARAFLYWSFLFACGIVIGAVGWSTQWAHWNAYIPAMTFGAIAAGLALVVLADTLGVTAAAAAALALAVNLGTTLWSPRQFIPTPADRSAGDKLVARIAAVPGDVFIPSHPWYAHLAGKRTYTHRMGIMDVNSLAPGKTKLPDLAVVGLFDALKSGRFGGVLLDDHDQLGDLPGLGTGYHADETVAGPHVVTGAATTPRTLWVPRKEPPLPSGTRAVFDFESGSYDGWTVTGDAWGPAPVPKVVGREVLGMRGKFFASSNTVGDKGTGTLLSPPFVVGGSTLSVRVGGGSGKGERVELRDAATGAVLRTATGQRDLSLRPVDWSVGDLRGRTVRLACVDEETGPWGVLLVDDLREIQ